MPQLWTETFVSQYFWLLVILFSFYYFISSKVIPTISETLKARQIVENKETIEPVQNESTNTEIFSINKTNIFVTESTVSLENTQQEWLQSKPEDNNAYWIDSSITSETVSTLEDTDENDQTLEEFLNSE